jgi:hypothetical protein
MRRRVLVSVPVMLGLALGAESASAQDYNPPIDVPTTPVPQGPQPPPPAAKPAPKPAPAPAPPPSKPEGAPPPAAGGDATPKEPLKFNNEGVFKVSGSKGSGAVGAGKGAGKASKGAPAQKGAVGKKTAQTANVAQWPGFRVTEDGGSEVMVDFSKDPSAPTEHKAAGSITYLFKGVHVAKHNNQNPLITVHFNTPVASARLVPSKGGLTLVIDLRPGVTVAPATMVRDGGESGGKLFVVKFPAGSYLPAGAEDAPDPTPTQKLKSKGDKKDEPAKSTTPPPSGTGATTKPGPNP